METYATYCPEDDKLRLYTERVPREEYLRLRGEGWTATPKQTCAFAAVWTPAREVTALRYALGGDIEDEDVSPEERAVQRATRFGGYRDRHLDAVEDHDPGEQVYGYQDLARAEKAAARQQRANEKVENRWDKADYWIRRTEGVIANALHRSDRGTRMGRINRLEADLRSVEGSERHTRVRAHLMLRLAYERQMLDATGGTLESVATDIVKGGRFRGALVVSVNKSPVTKRVKSIRAVLPGGRTKIYDTERADPGDYLPPTPKDLEELAAWEAAVAEARPVQAPLINPTEAEALRLQEALNPVETPIRATQEAWTRGSKSSYRNAVTIELVPGPREFGDIPGLGAFENGSRQEVLTALCRVRVVGNGRYRRVVVITDKPGKLLPEPLWLDPVPGLRASVDQEQLRSAVNSHTRTQEQSALLATAWCAGMLKGSVYSPHIV